ncbi:branched-chain amino acid ABC transporter permease [Ilumatobacter sp.]|uniref:branched-chain amino acid ABC transporter permease n=1 Tax=Ilumatobacter sp. TaxID=1967498 RepID=UPI003B525C85
MQLLVARIIDGLSNGATYAAIALALVLIFKATTLINFAQGTLAMLGGFGVYVLASEQGIPVWIALLISMILSGIVAAGLERTLIRPFDPADHLPLVIITLGLLLAGDSLAGVIWRNDPRAFPRLFPDGNVFTWGITQLRWYDVGVVVSVLVLVGLLELLLNKTRIGLAFRAVSSNLESSRLVGIKVGQTLMFGWALAAAVGTFAAVLYISSPIRQIEPTFMLRVLIFSTAAAALGGLDSVKGALVGGILMGIIQAFFGYVVSWSSDLSWFPDIGNELNLATAFLVLLVVLLVRPAGLFGTKSIERV